MARLINRLTARQIVAQKKPGLHADGRGLYLQVDRTQAKRWAFIFLWRGRRREMGLGSIHDVSLADARAAASQARHLVREGVDPIETRRIGRRVSVDMPRATFREVAEEVLETVAAGLTNPKHVEQWRTSLMKTAAPLASMPVDAITTEDILGVLKPVWTKVPESASRLRGRIERVLDAAKAKGLRTGDNPARWKGHLDILLPARKRLARGHHAAMPHDEIGGFMAALRDRRAVAARALQFTILTASRTNEVLGAKWSEVDLIKRVWAVPAERMKARVEHAVPLSMEAVRILTEVRPLQGGSQDSFIFPGQKRGQPLSQMGMLVLLRRMDLGHLTVHGFRSTFRDWAGDCTSFARDVIEAALAHTLESKVERAYRRSTAFEKRRHLLEAWAGYCGKVKSPVACINADRLAA